MTSMAFLGFFLLTLSFLSLWIRRDPKIWGSLLSLSLLCGLITGNVLWIGLVFLAALAALWLFYVKKPGVATFIALIVATLFFKLGLFPEFPPIFLTSKFQIGFPGAIIGLFPLALLVPLSRTLQDWKRVLQGLALGCGGIGILAILATIAGVAQWDFKLPSFMLLRTWGNLFLAAIPEEGFYRGFLQKGLSQYFGDTKKGKIAALFLTSLLFTFAHVYWSPDIALLGFVFLASLLYGGVYLYSEKIESAILCHFLLNLIHMIFFEYHAM